MSKQDVARFKKLRAWWKTPLGQAVIEEEKKFVTDLLPSMFGYQGLILSQSAFLSVAVEFPFKLKIWLDENAEAAIECNAIQARQDKLPIASDSIEMAYLAHCLEFKKNPHEILRETFRVLAPKGYVLISGFNPWSIWGLCKLFLRFTGRAPWRGHFISLGRLKDWLALLGFDVVNAQPYFFRPPISHTGLLKRLGWLEKLKRYGWPFSGAYLLLARKRIITLTPIRPEFRTPEKILVTEGIEPVRLEVS